MGQGLNLKVFVPLTLYVGVAPIELTQKNQVPLAPTFGLGFLSGVIVILILRFFQDKNEPD